MHALLLLLSFAVHDLPHWIRFPAEIGVEVMLWTAPSEARCWRILSQQDEITVLTREQVMACRWPDSQLAVVEQAYAGWHALRAAHSRYNPADYRWRSYFEARRILVGF